MSGALHRASHRSTDFVLSMPPSRRGASFESSSCTGTCNALRPSQQILPSWDCKKRIESAVKTLNISQLCLLAKADSTSESVFFTSHGSVVWVWLDFYSFTGNLSCFFVQVSKLPSMLQPMNVLDKKHAETGKNQRRNPCNSFAFESVVLCDVLS